MTAPAKRGRPKTTGTTPQRSIRVTAEEWAAWQIAAEKANKTVSDWLRDLANQAASK